MGAMLFTTSRQLRSPESASLTGWREAELSRVYAEKRGLAPIRVALVYDDPHAGQRAMRWLEQFETEQANEIRLNLVLWRFDRIARLIWRCHASDDVGSAEMVIMSLSRPREVPETIQSWLANCLERKRSGYITVLTLLRDENAATTIVLRRGGCVDGTSTGRAA